jgi:heme o synthase
VASDTVFATYYKLAKPGIVYGNVFTTLAAFLFASRWQFPPLLFLATLFGIAFVIGSACVFNNYLDRGIDVKMARTKDRALVTGAVSTAAALTYGSVLGLLGLALLFLYVNVLTACIALFGFIFYVVIYGVAKRSSHWGTVVGSVAGAVPIVVGYTAVTGRFDLIALILFLILALWQMPHFYAISIYRMEEYKNAGIPVLPIKKGVRSTKIHIVLYIAAFTLATSLLWLYGAAGYWYLIGMFVLGFGWFGWGIQGFTTTQDVVWARGLFFFSLVVLVTFSVLLSVAWILP